jgi:hypothetical protein
MALPVLFLPRKNDNKTVKKGLQRKDNRQKRAMQAKQNNFSRNSRPRAPESLSEDETRAEAAKWGLPKCPSYKTWKMQELEHHEVASELPQNATPIQRFLELGPVHALETRRCLLIRQPSPFPLVHLRPPVLFSLDVELEEIV